MLTSDLKNPNGSLYRLHAGHVAFMRAIIQGMEPSLSWKRYLYMVDANPTPLDIKNTINAIQAVFASTVRRYQRSGPSRLILPTKTMLQNVDGATPLLSEFIASQDLEGFSEAEQGALYQLHFKQQIRLEGRTSRLIARQLSALNWMQQQLDQRPSHDDLLSVWLPAHLVDRLSQVQLHHVSDLLTHITRFGTRWSSGIAAIGVIKTQKITQWAQHHTATLEATKDDIPASLSVLAIEPLRQLQNHAPILVHHTKQRLHASPKTCHINAQSDIEAILIWLQVKQSRTDRTADTASVPDWSILDNLSNTQRVYWKEAERFMLWLVIERHTALGAVCEADCYAYMLFLKAPPARWCGVRGRDKNHPKWRPFEAGLAPAAQAFAVGVVRGLYRYFVKVQYFVQSPWDKIVLKSCVTTVPFTVDRPALPLSLQAWDVIDAELLTLDPCSANARLRMTIQLLRATGMQLSQAVQATVDDIESGADSTTGWLHLSREKKTSRGSKPTAVAAIRKTLPIPLNNVLMTQLQQYLAERGLKADLKAASNRGAYLLGRATDVAARAPWVPSAMSPIDRHAGIGLGTVRDQIRKFFRKCALASVAKPELADEFKHARSHILRFTSSRF